MSENTQETENANNGTGTLVIPSDYQNSNNRIPDEVLNKLTDTSAVAEFFESQNAELEDYADEYGSGFEILERKDKLVDVPFLVVSWTFNTSKDYPNPDGTPGVFVTAYVITEKGDKYIVNDGSTGIRNDLYRVTELRRQKGSQNSQTALMVRKGLRRSDYNYVNPKTGEVSKATTFYLGK